MAGGPSFAKYDEILNERDADDLNVLDDELE